VSDNPAHYRGYGKTRMMMDLAANATDRTTVWMRGHPYKTGDKVDITHARQDVGARQFVLVTGPDSFELCHKSELPVKPKPEPIKPRRWKKRSKR